MKVIAKEYIRYKGERYAPGDVFNVEDPALLGSSVDLIEEPKPRKKKGEESV